MARATTIGLLSDGGPRLARRRMRMMLVLVLGVLGCSGSSNQPSKPPPAPAVPDAAPGGSAAAAAPDARIVVKERYKVAVLGIEVLGSVTPKIAADARKLTDYLRDRARDDPAATLDGTFRELIDEKLMQNCTNEAPSCMAQIGKSIGVDVLVYGHLEPVGAGYRITIRGLSVATGIVHTWDGTAAPTDAELKAAARTAYDLVIGRVE